MHQTRPDADAPYVLLAGTAVPSLLWTGRLA